MTRLHRLVHYGLFALIAACARRLAVLPPSPLPASSRVVDPGGAIEVLPPCPPLDPVAGSVRRATKSYAEGAGARAQLVVAIRPAPTVALIQLLARDSTFWTSSDSLGRAVLPLSRDTSPTVRVRAIGYHSALYRIDL